MNAHTSYAIIAILAVVGTMSVMPVFAANHEGNIRGLSPACPDCVGDVREQAMMETMKRVPITVWTDNASYDHDSKIMIEGHVASVKAQNIPVTLTVTSPSNNIVTIKQIDVDDQGGFSASLNTAGNLWKYDGTYTIRVQYGSQGTNDKVLVELTGGEKFQQRIPSSVSCGPSEVAATDQCIPFTITGGMVTGADINDKDNSIVVRISANDDGEIFLNPSMDTIGGIFTVLVDGEQWDDVIIDTDNNEVTVMFPAGTEEIEIIGAWVIPEFGTIAVMILAVAIVSIIAVTARSKLSAVPRF